MNGPLYIFGFFLTTMDSDNSVKGWHLHAKVAHVDGYIELVCKASAEDRIVWVVEVNDVEGHILCSSILLVSKGYRQRNFLQGINFISSETNQWRVRRL